MIGKLLSVPPVRDAIFAAVVILLISMLGGFR